MLKRGDIFIILLILISAVLVYAFPLFTSQSEATELLITVDGEDYRRIDLSDTTYTEQLEISGQYTNIIEIKDGTASFVYSDCPDKDCIKTGRLSKNHTFAACLPNRVSISIISSENEIDAVAW